MPIILFATESLSLKKVVAYLGDEGVDVRAVDDAAIKNIRSFEPDTSKAVLIVPRHGAGDPTDSFRRLLGKDRQLILCTPQPDSNGFEMLKKVGATEIITPRSWAPEHIAERVLAQLILDGDVTPSACGNLHGATRDMRDAYAEMAVISPLDDPVLITGETGTGKELFAREIHNLSKRSDNFLAINCAELSVELAGSDLFGHKKGSFTGATDAREGLLAAAGRGTVFLDEIGELDLKAQAKLLRVLEDKKVRRIGSNQTENVPARIVLATNRDLEFECEEGRFRQDLFERIRGFNLELKPLRERRSDIALLAEHFLAEFNQERDTTTQIAPGSIDCLFDYEWPGNVRELRAAIRRAAAFAGNDGFVSWWHLNQATRRSSKQTRTTGTTIPANAKYSVRFNPKVDTWKEFSARAQSVYFQTLLEVTGGDKKEARELSGLGTSQFYERLKAILKDNEGGGNKDSDVM